MHTAKDDELGCGTLDCELRKLERVARVVCMTDHVVALIVMTENDEPRAEFAPRRLNARVQLRVRQPEIIFQRRGFRFNCQSHFFHSSLRQSSWARRARPTAKRELSHFENRSASAQI